MVVLLTSSLNLIALVFLLLTVRTQNKTIRTQNQTIKNMQDTIRDLMRYVFSSPD